MFEVDPENTWIDPATGPVSTLIQSLNKPLVAAGPHPAEEVQSWIVSRQAPGGGALDVFVYFHLTASNHAVLYRWDGGVVPPPQLEYVQEEAMNFCESMGFMMDDLNFGSLPPDERGKLLESLPPFVEDLSTLEKDEEVGADAGASRSADPLDDFQRAKAARIEAGQASTSDFVSDQPADVSDLEIEVFDPDAAQAAPMLDGDDMEIEITEVDGLDLVLAGTPAPDMAGSAIPEEGSGPPVVMGSIQPDPRRREATPADQVEVFDTDLFAAPSEVAPNEISIDDMLADVDAPASADGDLSSKLDDILDDVDGARPAAAAAPPAPPEPVAEFEDLSAISIDLTVDDSASGPSVSSAEAIAALDAMNTDTGAGAAASATPEPSPPSSPEFISPNDEDLGLEKLSVDSLLEDELESGPEPPEAAPSEPPAASPLDALEAAWASDGGEPKREHAVNGNGRGPAGAGGTLDLEVGDLARILAML